MKKIKKSISIKEIKEKEKALKKKIRKETPT